MSPCALLMGRRLWQPSCRVTVHYLVTLGAVCSPGGSASDCPKENLNTRPKAVQLGRSTLWSGWEVGGGLGEADRSNAVLTVVSCADLEGTACCGDG